MARARGAGANDFAHYASTPLSSASLPLTLRHRLQIQESREGRRREAMTAKSQGRSGKKGTTAEHIQIGTLNPLGHETPMKRIHKIRGAGGRQAGRQAVASSDKTPRFPSALGREGGRKEGQVTRARGGDTNGSRDGTRWFGD